MTVSSAGVEDSAPFLSRERIVAGPGFNRWLVPPAALAIHLCIGMAYGFSVFWLPLSKALGIDGSRCACPKDMSLHRRAVHDAPATGTSRRSAGCTRCSSCSSAAPRRCGAAGSSAPARARPASSRRLCWCGGLCHLGGRRLHPSDLAAVARLRRHRRHRARARLHLAGVDADQVVSRPARHGDRHGHHGLRRRRDDRLAARGPLMKHYLPPPTLVGVWQTFVAHGAHLLRLHDGRRASAIACRPPAGSPPAGRRRRRPATRMITPRNVHLKDALEHAAVLAAVGRAVPERDGRHRHSRHGLAAAAGSVRRQADRHAELELHASSSKTQLAARSPAIAAGFTGLLSLFNIAGRIFWASLSDARAQG